MTWVDNITKGASDILEIKKNNFALHIENMDTKRHHSKEHYSFLAKLYKNKYSNMKFDLILSSDNNALDFLKKYRNEIFGNVPVSFCGVNNFKPSSLDTYENYTGVTEKFSDIQTIELILNLHPDIKNIYIINDYLKTGRAWQKKMEKNLARFEDKVNIIHNKNLSLKDLQKKIKSLSKDTILLIGVYYADKNNKYITYEKTGEYLLDISPVPVYSLLRFNITQGVIGGKVTSGYYQGAMMAKLGISILQGMEPKSIDIVTQGANKYIFNKQALEKFNIDIKTLPKGSIFINETKSIYQKYGMTTSLILIFFAVVLILILIIYYRKDLTSEKGIIKLLIYAPMILIPTIIAILIFVILNNNQLLHKEDIKDLQKQYILNQKQKTMNQIEELSKYIYNSPLSKKEILNYISNIKYGKDNYIFVFNKKSELLVHPKKDLVGENTLNYTNKNGEFYFKKLIENGIRNSLDFVRYQWENPKTKKIDTKYTYVKYIPKHDIFIASGVYDQDIQKLIDDKTKEMNDSNNKQIEQILVISFVVLIISTILALILSNIIKNIFDNYNKEIDKKNQNLKDVNKILQIEIKKEVTNNRKKDQLLFQQSKMASMGEMIGNIAHQWRQPLSVISTGATGMIAKKEFGILNDEDILKTCKTINKNAQYLSQTIDDFKNYIKNDRQVLQFNLKDNFNNLLSLLNGSIKTHEINVVLDIPQNLSIDGYPNELIQCNMNILNNAKDALKNCDYKRYIFINVQKQNSELIIKIKDNAGGVPEEILPKIYEPYFTTKHKSQGTGLGLSMTYNMIVDGMKGSIDASNVSYTYKNKVYKGAEFIIKLPII